jgi:hypothetical protein
MSILQRANRIYLTVILPRAKVHARVALREYNPDLREELEQEMFSLLWLWTLRLLEQGKDPRRFPTVLAVYAARHVRSGRKLCGKEKADDVLSFTAQAKHGFTVVSLPDYSSLCGNVFDEALHDNTQTPVPDQVCFRLDFPRWLSTWDDRRRRIALAMASGEKTSALADQFGCTWGRVSQMRREYHLSWQRFCGDAA